MKRGAAENSDTPIAKKQKTAEEKFLKLHENNYHFDIFSKLIFSDVAQQNTPAVALQDPNFKVVITNNTHYLTRDIPYTFQKNHYPGKQLYLNDDTPIGYNLHIPKGEIKGIFVYVYGGGDVKARKSLVKVPEVFNDLCVALAERGYAIVTLNLLDINENFKDQRLMSEDIHKRLHASINKFFETIKTDPLFFNHPRFGSQEKMILESLKNKKIFLMGSSFGGRTAVKHAELYPHTFDGYISFAGALSYKMREKCLIGCRKANDWLDPANDLSNIQDPILILHNMDDNQVNVKIALDWYKKAIKAGKKDLIQLFIIEKGGKANNRNLDGNGHGVTENLNYFEQMMQAIHSFVENDPYHIEVSEWRAHHYNILANKNYPSATLEQQFISYAFRLYMEGKELNDENWKNHFAPLYYALHYLNNCLDNHNFKDQWSKEFKGYFDKEIKNLKASGVLNEKVAKSAVKFYLGNYLSFLNETGMVKNDDFDNIQPLFESQDIAKQFLQRFEGTKSSMSFATYKFHVSALFLANPELLKDKYAHWENDADLQKILKDVRKKLEVKIKKDQDLIDAICQPKKQKLAGVNL
ncbi:MAG: prolyl oligopeptidase family serine peptidase [Proteobacteria bacterium]|nr:prolyl oligopeptidase family serine peptidase [Pseudomonadota bacterium]